VTQLTNFDLLLMTILNDMRLLAAFGFDGSLHVNTCPALKQSHLEHFHNTNGFYHLTAGNVMTLPTHTHRDSYGHGKVTFVMATYGSKTWAVAPNYAMLCPKDVPATAINDNADFVAFNYNPFFPNYGWCRQTAKILGTSHAVRPMQFMFLPSHHAHAIYTDAGGGIGALLQIATDTFHSHILPGLYHHARPQSSHILPGLHRPQPQS
jgi:hypothetical protein